MATRRLVAVSAGTGVPSSTRLLADRLTTATLGALADRGVPVQVRAVELRELGHDLVDATTTGLAPPRLRDVLDDVAAADGLVVATPVLSASYSGLLKLVVDALDRDALAGTPVLLAATGGTARHSLVLDHALRPLFSYLRAVVVPTGVFAAPEDWAGAGGAGDGGDVGGALIGRVGRAAGELAALVAARRPTARPDAFAAPVPFDLLLRAGAGGSSAPR